MTKFKLDATLKVLRSPNMSAISSRAAHARRFRNHCLVHHRDRCRPPARISVLIHNSFLFLKWNRRFDSRAFTASTTLRATGAGEFHKHSIFYPEAAGRKCLRPFQFGGRRYTETAFEGYCQPPFPVILRGVSPVWKPDRMRLHECGSSPCYLLSC